MSKAFAKSLSQLNRALIRRLNSLVIRAQPPPHGNPDGHVVAAATLDALPAAPAGSGGGGASVCMVEGGLLRSSSAFPYFMLVALEAGGLLRALVLLLLYPALRLLVLGRRGGGVDVAVRAMAAVSFLGLRTDALLRAGRAALPRLLLEDVSAEVFDAAVAGRRRCVCVSAVLPRAVVEPFLKEYLGVDAVVAPEMREFRGRYLGVMQGESEVLRARGLDVEKVIACASAAEKGGGGGGGGSDVVVGVGGLGSSSSFAHLFQKHCKVSTHLSAYRLLSP
jgi:glycerol-3-phosphate acyltransferase